MTKIIDNVFKSDVIIQIDKMFIYRLQDKVCVKIS